MARYRQPNDCCGVKTLRRATQGYSLAIDIILGDYLRLLLCGSGAAPSRPDKHLELGFVHKLSVDAGLPPRLSGRTIADQPAALKVGTKRRVQPTDGNEGDKG